MKSRLCGARSGLPQYYTNNTVYWSKHLTLASALILTYIIYLREVNIKAQDKKGRTPLLTAAAHGKNVIDSLLRGGASLEDKDEDDKTIIHLAVESGSHTVLKMSAEKLQTAQSVIPRY